MQRTAFGMAPPATEVFGTADFRYRLSKRLASDRFGRFGELDTWEDCSRSLGPLVEMGVLSSESSPVHG